jgi:hypothetical protein
MDDDSQLLTVADAPPAPEVDDDAEKDLTVPSIRYEITSYGADYDVEGLVRRLKRGEIFVPKFQRDFVWKQPEASRFIESLLLGLPVPGIFLAKEPDTNKFLVIDGQQRLRSLQYFYDGVFNPREGDKKQRVFELTGVQERFDGKTYGTLEEPDRLRLDNSILHATVVKQDSPLEDDTSIYHIFERLNSAGRLLTPQEIRVALYHGRFMDEIRRLNGFAPWREIFGKLNPRLKDQELILRFLALYFGAGSYERPMAEFINKFTASHQRADDAFLASASSAFEETIAAYHRSLGREAFRPGRTLNAAIFDSAMVGLARRLAAGPPPTDAEIAERYRALIADHDYAETTSRSTSDEAFVRTRLQKASEFFET